MAVTTDGKLVIPGDFVFRLGDQDGFPLWAVLDECQKVNAVIDWIGYVEAARKAGWWDFQTIKTIEEGFSDAEIPKDSRRIIRDRIRWYMLCNPLAYPA